MKSLRPYQIELSKIAADKLNDLKIVYLAFEVRTGKTATALQTAYLFGAINVLFITKKKAIKGIQQDYKDFSFDESFDLTVINNESLHKIDPSGFDLLISDEHHRNGAFPKPNKVTKLIKERYSNLPMIFLSGTMNPESYSQIYHQFFVSQYTPFYEFTNFYKWARRFVDVVDKYVSYGQIKDYSNARYDEIQPIIKPYIISFTQKEAGFETSVKEEIIKVKLKESTYKLIDRLKRDKVIQGKNELILADTGVKLQSKIHQLFSGTIKFESGESMVIDYSKAEAIRKKFYGYKIGIFYKFKEELNALKTVFGDKLTTDLQEFNDTDSNIALQIVSGREGISLKEADYLVYYNIDFSAVSYWQSRDRLTTMERKENKIYWVFAECGIEPKIYKSVLNKKNYTLSTFKKDYGVNFSK